MSYNFSQLRFSQINKDDYMTNLSYTIKDFKTESPISQGVEFTDKKIEVNLKSVVNKIKSYYIRFSIEKQNTDQKITLLLKNDKEKDNTQTIDTFTVNAGMGISNFEYIITPNETYNRIELILNRNEKDYDGANRKIVLSVNKLAEVNNIIDKINDVNKLKQIGVQGNTGLLMDIEGEGIKIGNSGIYEINNGVVISFLGFIIEPEDKNKYFILDYQY